MANEDLLKSQGILAPNEQFETIYLAEDEIDKFMETYLKENPGAEIETRYINQPPVELTQNIEVRWLRPETPEIPPIIIKEVDVVESEQPPIRIVETRKEKEEQQSEPVIIREKPPFILIPEPKIAYVQNITKREVKSDGKPIKIEHVRSESQSTFNNTTKNKNSRLDFEEPARGDPNYSFEEHASIIDEYEEEYEQRRSTIEELPEDFRTKHKIYEDEHQLRLYEEKLKQTLYEEYLLRLERERLERKLSRSGLLEERIRERSISQDRLAELSNRFSNGRIREEEAARLRQVREHQMKHHIIKERHTQSLDMQSNDTSSYRNIKFYKVTDENELNRLNAILNNPNSLSLKSKAEADKIASSLFNLEQDSLDFNNNSSNSAFRTNYVREEDYYYFRTHSNSSMVDGIDNINELASDRRYRKEYQTSSSANLSKNVFNKSSSGDFANIPRTESERRYLDDLRAYELYNEGLRSNSGRISENSVPNNNKPNDLNLTNGLNTTNGSNGNGVRRHRITTIKKYYHSNLPNNNYTERNVYVKNS